MHFEVAVSVLPSNEKLSVAVDPSIHRTFWEWKSKVEAEYEKAYGQEIEVRVFERRSTSEVLSMDRSVPQELKIIRYVDAHTAYPPIDEIFKLPWRLTEADLSQRAARSWKACARYFQLPNALAILRAAGHYAAARELAEDSFGARGLRCQREAKGEHRAGLVGSGAGAGAGGAGLARGPWGGQLRGALAGPGARGPPSCPTPSRAPGPPLAAIPPPPQPFEGQAPARAAPSERPSAPVQKVEPCKCAACLRPQKATFPGLADGYVVAPAQRIPLEDAHLVRESYVSSAWSLDGSTGEFRPPPMLERDGRRVPNPVFELGACGCPAYHVRPDFVAFCLQHIRAQFTCDQSIVYVTLGSGALYHDWEVIEELLSCDYRIAEVHAVDTSYKSSLQEAEECRHSRRAASALKAFAAWLATEEVELKAYEDMESLSMSVRDAAHVLMQCDADCPSQCLEPVLAKGGLHLHMTQATGECLEAWRKPCLPSWFGKRRPHAGELASKHAVLQGLALLERRNGLDDIDTCGLGLARGQRRERALRAGELWCVVGEHFPEAAFTGCVGACHQPRVDSTIVRFHNIGEELVIDPRSATADGWIRLSSMQLDGPVSGEAGWLLLREEQPFGRLLEQVVEVAVTVSHAVEEGQQARVTVPSTATVLEVKAALAKQLRRPEILRRARLVKKISESQQDGHLIAYKDGERLDGQQSVLLLGLDDLKAAGGEAAPHFTRYRAWRILREMQRHFSDPAFHRRLQKLGHKRKGGAILAARILVAGRHGFESTMEGADLMGSEVKVFASRDLELQQAVQAMHAALAAAEAQIGAA